MSSSANRNAAEQLVKMGMSGVRAYTRPTPISLAPLTSNGTRKKIWVQTPYESAHGILRSYGWQSPAPTLSLGSKYRKSRKSRKLRKSRRSK